MIFIVKVFNSLFLLQAKSIAKQKAEQLNERLNYIPSELIPGVETETELQYFEEEIEINDFPQQIRYKICSRVKSFTIFLFVSEIQITVFIESFNVDCVNDVLNR